MSHLTSLLLHPDAFDGHDAQRYFASHTALPLSVVVLYLAMVRYLPRYMHTRPPFELRVFSRCWNLSVAAFSVCGMLVCVPHLASQLLEHGFYYTVCHDIYELAGYRAPALWAALFTWSKLFEPVDTLLLILKKRPVIVLHWFHHASVIIFAWSAWIYETPAALWYGAMNYSVHALMYTYFAVTSVPRFRPAAMRVAPFITSLQISQFAWGTVINTYVGIAYASPTVGCAIKAPILYIGAGLYLAYGVLFTKLFVDRYLRPRSTSSIKGSKALRHCVEGGGGGACCGTDYESSSSSSSDLKAV